MATAAVVPPDSTQKDVSIAPHVESNRIEISSQALNVKDQRIFILAMEAFIEGNRNTVCNTMLQLICTTVSRTARGD